ncbi:hypothetical protein H5410_045886 [Solanum commersonii]|uniref:Uncharacterized protein n=1 Tax=Solanum commersonii TaxID=4109 RepID=A0A9J5XE12_SOLCO|nr:hypothetical protein H5410_045886 [Solanum commersonii]
MAANQIGSVSRAIANLPRDAKMVNDKQKWPDRSRRGEFSRGACTAVRHSPVVQPSQMWLDGSRTEWRHKVRRWCGRSMLPIAPLSEAPFLRGQSPYLGTRRLPHWSGGCPVDISPPPSGRFSMVPAGSLLVPQYRV